MVRFHGDPLKITNYFCPGYFFDLFHEIEELLSLEYKHDSGDAFTFLVAKLHLRHLKPSPSNLVAQPWPCKIKILLRNDQRAIKTLILGAGRKVRVDR